MANKIKTTTGTVKKQILFATQPSMTVGAVMSAAGAIAVGNRKTQKAGTPVTGDLTARTTAFTKSTAGTDAVGVLLHDVDVTSGDENATILIFGFVDLNKVEEDAAALITAETKTALTGKVTFLK